MPIIHAIVLGAVQGLSEFLPISSSGHLILVPWLFRWNDFAGQPGLEKAFDTALHIGTTVAMIGYFWRDLSRLVVAGLGSIRRRSIVHNDERLAWLLLLSAIPGVITGALLDNFITENLGQEWLIAIMLIVFGIILWAADRLPGKRPDGDFRRRDAVMMGTAQALALQPGVSRSGVTISAGRYLGFDRDGAARVSFLMATPITAGAATYKMLKLQTNGGVPHGFGAAFAWGIVVSGVVGFLAVAGLMRLVRTRTFTPFVIYRIALGLFVLTLIATGVR